MISFFYFLRRIWTIFSALMAGYFSLLAQRKVTKRKGTPVTRPSDALNVNNLLGCCATRKQRSDMLALNPRSFIYISARSKGGLKAHSYLVLFLLSPRLSSLRSECLCERVFREDCLNERFLRVSSAAASHNTSNEGTRSVSESGANFFGYFLFSQKKVTRPSGAKPMVSD
jgi:hypothetical protein